MLYYALSSSRFDECLSSQFYLGFEFGGSFGCSFWKVKTSIFGGSLGGTKYGINRSELRWEIQVFAPFTGLFGLSWGGYDY
nr:MAG TPA: hypothetical protein [Caudoviricetes sp.]